MKPLAFVVAADNQGCIGANGKLPWHYPEDLKHFYHVTRDHSIIMGRKTWESIGKPLKDRRNIVVSSNPAYQHNGVEFVPSIGKAIEFARTTDHMPRIIGGSTIFEATYFLATVIFLTRIHKEFPGDTFIQFPLQEQFTKITSHKGINEDLSFEVWINNRNPNGF